VLKTIYRDIFKEMSENNAELLIMGVDETKFLKTDKIAIKQHIIRLRRMSVKEKLLGKESATVFFAGSQSEYKLISDHLFNPNPTHIYGNKIAIVVWGTPTYGIIIKSDEIADSNKKFFKVLWATGKKLNKNRRDIKLIFPEKE
jgi:hypothetical protein